MTFLTQLRFYFLQVLGKLWSALPLEEKDKYERKVEKQRIDQERQRIDNERQELQENLKIVAKECPIQSKKSGGKESEKLGNKVNQLSDVPDPYLIFRLVYA